MQTQLLHAFKLELVEGVFKPVKVCVKSRSLHQNFQSLPIWLFLSIQRFTVIQVQTFVNVRTCKSVAVRAIVRLVILVLRSIPIIIVFIIEWIVLFWELPLVNFTDNEVYIHSAEPLVDMVKSKEQSINLPCYLFVRDRAVL